MLKLDVAVQRDGRTPVYVQVKTRLREAIQDGRLVNQIPAERQLADLFGISYMTARKAVSDLVDEGLLMREHGRGTFVRVGAPAPRNLNIGIVIPSPVRFGAANPYFSRVIQGIADEARNHGFRQTVMASSCNDFIAPGSGKDPRPTAQVAGIIALALSEKDYAAAHEARRYVPVVAIDSAHHEEGIPNFVCDNRAGGRLATEHLIRLGHRRIACIAGSLPSQVTQERLAGYHDALAAAGMAQEPSRVLFGDFEFDGGYNAAGRLFLANQPPTGLVCANDATAFGACRKLQEMGRQIPEDVSVVGFDDIIAASYVTPGLTTVSVPKEDLGWLAIQALVSAIAGAPAPTRLVLPVALVVRQSTSHPAP